MSYKCNLKALDGVNLSESIITYAVLVSSRANGIERRVSGYNPESGESDRAVDIAGVPAHELLEDLIKLGEYWNKLAERVNEAISRQIEESK
jgi:hypothetical protein